LGCESANVGCRLALAPIQYSHLADMQSERPVPQLSPREHQLLKLAAEGLTDLAIAARLGISEATVGTYWGRVRIKFGPFSRTELVAMMMRAEQEAAVSELRKQNAHLISEIKALGTPADTISYRALLECAPDAMILISETGMIEFANKAAYDMFAFERDELHGLNHNDIIPERYRGMHAEFSNGYFAYPDRRPMGEHFDTPAMRKDGSEFLIRASLAVIESPAGMHAICVIREV